MPLEGGSSNAVVGRNIKELRKSGYPERQAVAIALNKAHKHHKAKKMSGRS